MNLGHLSRLAGTFEEFRFKAHYNLTLEALVVNRRF